MPALNTYLVEDSAVVRGNLTSVLEETVPIAMVGTADDEATAVNWLKQQISCPDLLIVDIFLKQGSGLGVLRAAQALAPRLAVVVLTNFATPEMNRKCLELGAARVFDKSNELAELVNYCNQLAGRNVESLAAVGLELL